MAIAVRAARTTWQGGLAGGTGNVESTTGAFDPLPVTWASRTEHADGKTSPEELAAAAHSSCFSMALSLGIGEQGFEVDRLTVEAAVSLDEVGGRPTIVSSALTVRAVVPGMSDAQFTQALNATADLCPVSRLFAGAEITVDGTLEAG